MVHLGLGAFFRAHAAVYTAHAGDASEWGIAAFSGRSHDLAERLAAQDGLYTLSTRGPSDDDVEVIPSVVAAHPGDDLKAWASRLADPEVRVVTLTVTEAAYRAGPGSVAPRLVDGLDRRRRAGAGPVTIVPCDNVTDNGAVLGRLVVDEAERRGVHLTDWILDNVDVVGTVVDRITPRPTAADVDAVKRHGWIDSAPVVTEPFTEWVLSGPDATDAVGGLPDWASAGAVFVDDLGPYTRRKLHLLNGAHSLLAYVGLARGHTEVAGATADPVIRDLMTRWWDEAAGVVGGGVEMQRAYRAALVTRFDNPRIHHRLDQIAVDGSVKLPQRVVPVARTRRSAGRGAPVAAAVVGAWAAHVHRTADSLADARADQLRSALVRTDRGPASAVRALVDLLAPELATDTAFLEGVSEAAVRFAGIDPERGGP